MQKEQLDIIKNKIINSLKPINANKIILFGSYVYGNPTKDSDLDICIIEDNFSNKYKEKSKIRELLKDINIPKDIILTKDDEYQFYKNEINSVFNDIENKGEVLWQRSS
jgi:predicted nucleotidyltransferase